MAPPPAAAPRPAERFDDRRRHGGYAKDYKRKSWLTEIFD